jgi:uncharacterized phage-associated protein
MVFVVVVEWVISRPPDGFALPVFTEIEYDHRNSDLSLYLWTCSTHPEGFMFNERKVAQIAAYLLHLRGGCMSHLKLMKLMYLSDRASYDQFGRSMTGDRAVSMRHGPVLSRTLDLMDGDEPSSAGGWDIWISAKENNELSLRKEVRIEDLDQLSNADRRVLDQVFARFGRMGRWDIRNFSHTLPEWHDPHGSMLPIATEDILQALGKTADEIDGLINMINEDRRIDALLASL